MLDQAGNGRHKLLNDVPINIRHQRSTTLHHFIEAVGGVFEGELAGCRSHASLPFLVLVVLRRFTDDVADEVVDQVCRGLDSLPNQAISDDDVRQALEVCIFTGCPG